MTPAAVQRLLELARSKVGQAEKGGPNMGPIVEWSIERWTHRDPGPWARWCAAFVSTCIDEAGAGGPNWLHLGSMRCSTLWTHLVEERDYEHGHDVRDVQPGDLVFFAQPQATCGFATPHHVGLVERLDDVLHTIEGNAGNAVRERTYELSFPQLWGWVRLPDQHDEG